MVFAAYLECDGVPVVAHFCKYTVYNINSLGVLYVGDIHTVLGPILSHTEPQLFVCLERVDSFCIGTVRGPGSGRVQLIKDTTKLMKDQVRLCTT